MVINYQDKNLIVMYIQILLSEYYGVYLEKVIPRKKSEQSYYNTVSLGDFKVTGYYNQQTYSSLALYMFESYPNERYPFLWKEVDSNTWEKDESIWDEIYSYGSENVSSIYQDLYDEKYSKNYTDYEEFLDEIKSNTDFREEVVHNLVVNQIIVPNIESSIKFRGALEVPERVLSYLFNEVVTPISTAEEIVRVRKMFGQSVSYNPVYDPLVYDDDLMDKVKKVQKKFIDNYTVNGEISLPINFRGFKVTGYVDPWTEKIISQGGAD